MDQRILSMEMRALGKSVDRYLGETMPASATDATGGNAHIIMFLARNRDKDIYQHTIERKFCITRSTASRVLTLMEKKGLIVREPVAHDARLKKIMLTAKADAIVADLKRNGEHMERLLVAGFSEAEQAAMFDYVRRMRANIDKAQRDFEMQRDFETHGGRNDEQADMTDMPDTTNTNHMTDTKKKEGDR
ncbi:MarR family winged helix-turn-helix transcriptional regulator [Bifidobacterium simiarum]|uniref:MarR family winged helix-turn-helix transcriptional regulator n=1 Tax=Bifidobacterium simiarum TaxID=2045441 RepID=UPI001BDCBC09|nr:MarR family transcriptional regulator [Bifidobacterium simiarum]